MSEKREIKLSKNAMKFVIGAIIIPLLLTFILEHFGKFEAKGMGSVNDSTAETFLTMDTRLYERGFQTFFGNKIEENLYHKNLRLYREADNGNLEIFPIYSERIPYYLKALYLDIIYPLILSTILVGVYFFRKKIKIKLTDNDEN